MQLITGVFQIMIMVLFSIVARTNHLDNQCSHVSGVPCHHCHLGVTIQWTGLLDWTTGLDYWTI